MVRFGPDFNVVTDVLEPLVRTCGSETALIDFDEGGRMSRTTFARVAEASAAAAGVLVESGTEQGSTVLTLMGSTPAWVATTVGAWGIGAVALPCNELLRAPDLAVRLDGAKPKVAVVSERNLEEFERALEMTDVSPVVVVPERLKGRPRRAGTLPAPRLGAEAPSTVVYTSGTTGRPRGVVHGQRFLFGQELQSKYWVDARPGDVIWCTAKPGWSKSTRNGFLAAWLGGAAAVLDDRPFDPVTRLETAARAGVTILCQAPTEHRMIARRAGLAPEQRCSLRRLLAAGEFLNPEISIEFKETLGLYINDQYGQTETGAVTSMLKDEDVVPGSMGRTLPGIEIAIDETGELIVDLDTVPTRFIGYLGEPPVKTKRWRTGDLVERDADGILWYRGRADNIIVSAGYRIGPEEVESALLSHPLVAEAAAVGVPDAERGSIVKAYVVTRDGTSDPGLASKLQEHAKLATAPYKYPRTIEFVQSLPKTRSGKIRRAALRGD